jgi:hypothetical protein
VALSEPFGQIGLDSIQAMRRVTAGVVTELARKELEQKSEMFGRLLPFKAANRGGI